MLSDNRICCGEYGKENTLMCEAHMTPCAIADLRIGNAYHVEDRYHGRTYQAILSDVSMTEYTFYIWDESRDVSISRNDIGYVSFHHLPDVRNSNTLLEQIDAIRSKYDAIRSAAKQDGILYEGDAVYAVEKEPEKLTAAVQFLLAHHFPYSVLCNIPYILNRQENNDAAFELLIYAFLSMIDSNPNASLSLPVFQSQENLYDTENKRIMRRCARELRQIMPADVDVTHDFRMQGVVTALSGGGKGRINLLSDVWVTFNMNQVAENRLYHYLRSGLNGSYAEVEFSCALAADGSVIATRILPTDFTAHLIDSLVSSGRINYPIDYDPAALPETYYDMPVCGVSNLSTALLHIYEWTNRSPRALSPVGTKRGTLLAGSITEKKNCYEGLIISESNTYSYNSHQIIDGKLIELLSSKPNENIEVLFEPCMNFKKYQDMVYPMADAIRLPDSALRIPVWFSPDTVWDESSYSDEAVQEYATQEGASPDYISMQPWLPVFDEYVGMHAFGTLKINPTGQSCIQSSNNYTYVFRFDQVKDAFLYSILNSRLVHMLDWSSFQVPVLFVPFVFSGEIPRETINADGILLTFTGRLTLKKQINALFHPADEQLPHRVSNLLIPVRQQYMPWTIRKNMSALNAHTYQDCDFSYRFDNHAETKGILYSVDKDAGTGKILTAEKEKVLFSFNQISDEALRKSILNNMAADLDVVFEIHIAKKEFSTVDISAVQKQTESRLYRVADKSGLQADRVRLTEEGKSVMLLRDPGLIANVPPDSTSPQYRSLQDDLLMNASSPQAEESLPESETVESLLKQMISSEEPNEYDACLASENDSSHSFTVNTNISAEEYQERTAFFKEQATQAKKALGDLNWREAAVRFLVRYDVLSEKYDELCLLLDAVNRSGLFQPAAFVRLIGLVYATMKPEKVKMPVATLKRIVSAIISAAGLLSLNLPELRKLQRLLSSTEAADGTSPSAVSGAGNTVSDREVPRYFGTFSGLNKYPGRYDYISLEQPVSGICGGISFSFIKDEDVFVHRLHIADTTLLTSASPATPQRVSFTLIPPNTPGHKPQADQVKPAPVSGNITHRPEIPAPEQAQPVTQGSSQLDNLISQSPYLSACVALNGSTAPRHIYYANLTSTADLVNAVFKDAESHFTVCTRSASRCAACLCVLAAKISDEVSHQNAESASNWLKIAGIDPNKTDRALQSFRNPALPFFTGTTGDVDEDDRQYIVMLLRAELSDDLLNAVGALSAVLNEQNSSWIRQITRVITPCLPPNSRVNPSDIRNHFRSASLEAKNRIHSHFSRYGGLDFDKVIDSEITQEYSVNWWNDLISARIDQLSTIINGDMPEYIMTSEEIDQTVQFRSILSGWRKLYCAGETVSFLMNGLASLRVECSALWSNLLNKPTEIGCTYLLPRVNAMRSAAEQLYRVLCRKPYLQVCGTTVDGRNRRDTIIVDDANRNYADEVNVCRKITLKIENSGINQACRNIIIRVRMNGTDSPFEFSGLTSEEQEYRPVNLASNQSMDIVCRFTPRSGFENQLRRDFSFVLTLEYEYEEEFQVVRHIQQSILIRGTVAEWDAAKDALINPFSVSRDGMNDDEIAYGRDDLIDTLYHQIWDETSRRYRNGCFLIYGQRRVGKTTVIQKLNLRLREEALGNQQPIIICQKQGLQSSLSGSTLNEISMYRNFAYEICRRARKQIPDFELGDQLKALIPMIGELIPESTASPYECFANRFLFQFNELFDPDALPHIVLFIDEFNTLYNGMLNGGIPISSVNRLLRLSEDIPQITMIIASADIYLSMNALDTGLSNTFEHVRKYPIFGIDYESSMKLICRSVKNTSGLESAPRFSRICADTIYFWTGGNPNYMTQICGAAIGYLNQHSLTSMRPDNWADFSSGFFAMQSISSPSFYESQTADARRADSLVYTNLLQVYNARLLGEIGSRSLTIRPDMLMSCEDMRYVAISELNELLPEEPVWTEDDLTRIFMNPTDSDRQKLAAIVKEAARMNENGELFTRSMAVRWLCDRHVLESDMNGGYRLTLPLYAVHRNVAHGYIARIYEKTINEI